MRAAVLFPGQGAYNPRAVVALADAFPEVAEVYAEVDKGAHAGGAAPVSPVLLGGSPPTIEALLADGPETLQLSIFALSLAVYRVLAARSATAAVFVGHSLGEISALTAGGALSVEAGAEVVVHRCVALREQGVSGTMMALGCDAVRAEAILSLIDSSSLSVAAENSPTQTIISGPTAAVEDAAAVARALRVEAVALKAPYPFHNPLLEKTAAVFASRIENVVRSRPSLPVYSPILGRYYEQSDDPCRVLPSQLLSRVRFARAARQLRAGGVDTFVEAGIGSVLVKLVSHTVEQAVAVPTVETTLQIDDSVSAAVSLLCGTSSASAAHTAPSGGTASREARPTSLPVLLDIPASQAPRTVELQGDDLGTANACLSVASRAKLFDELRTLYSEALEYPAEVFNEDVSLEADLGVDSVKQTELFARTVERYQLPSPTDDLQLGDYTTMGQVVDLVWSLLDNGHIGVCPKEIDDVQNTRVRQVAPQVIAAAGNSPVLPMASVTTELPSNRASLFVELRSLYADALEYPPEVFTEEVGLESDLGVDSVKQTELFARTVERYQLPMPSEEIQLGDFDTMGKVVDLVWSFFSKGTSAIGAVA